MLNHIKLYRKWFKTWKSFPVYSWIKAAALYSNGRYQEAAEQYRHGIARHPNHPAGHCARLDLSYCLFRTGKLKEAEKELLQVTSNLPQSREGFLRLARLQIWTGRSLEAAWTIRRALRTIPADAELAGTYLFAVLENGGPAFLLQEAVKTLKLVDKTGASDPRLEAARARLMMRRGQYDQGRKKLEEIVSGEEISFEALLLFAQVLLEEDKIARARRELRRALKAVPNHPRVLSLLAESYLKAGPFYNPGFALQNATKACQHSGWISPREMHILAEAYYHNNDRISALLVASKARDEGSRLLGEYPGVKNLDRLIESLSSGTQA
ncbi:MAG: hypothetical protein D6719_07190 [Candidatus Dadabacteria bacterium]|nr:MAG: hypothetical protein D6719_07190 [Candidatus Dadabacteria bacterium]